MWDSSPMAFFRWVVFSAYANPIIKPEHINNWFSTFVFQAAQRALNGREPLSYEDIKRLLEDEHPDSFPAKQYEQMWGPSQFLSPIAGGSSERGRGGDRGRGRGSGLGLNPSREFLCHNFNTGTCQRRAAPGGCSDNKRVFLHQCDVVSQKDGKVCGSPAHDALNH